MKNRNTNLDLLRIICMMVAGQYFLSYGGLVKSVLVPGLL